MATEITVISDTQTEIIQLETPSIAVDVESTVIEVDVAQQGRQGIKGEPGERGEVENIVVNEVPAGAVNTMNTTFTTAFSFASDSTEIFINGLKQTLNIAYTENANHQIIFDEPLWPGAQLTINYIKQ